MSRAPSYPSISISDVLREGLQRRLITWFDAGHRDLPWRRVCDPYAIWVSEIMLQQTQVATVIPYYERFMAAFPSVEALAGAELEAVLSLWRGLGYYARARNLHRGARYVVEHCGGRVPETIEGIRSVPGIGPYTAGAILSIAYSQPVPLLDGNVARVFCRYFGRIEDPKSTAGQKALWGLAGALVPGLLPGHFNQALMELGAQVCSPTSPACGQCPIREGCHAAQLPDPTVFPVRSERRVRPEAHAVGLILEREDGAILFGLRPPDGLLGGLWELPTGLMEPGADPVTAVQRVGLARLKVPVYPIAPGVVVEHIFTHLKLTFRVMRCTVGALPMHLEAEPVMVAGPEVGLNGELRRRRGGIDQIEVSYQQWRWISPIALSTLPMGRATLKALEAISSPLQQLGLFG